MKGKLVMRCRPEGDGMIIKSNVALKDVDEAGKFMMMRSFLKALEIDHRAAARWLTHIASGAVDGENRRERREATEMVVDE